MQQLNPDQPARSHFCPMEYLCAKASHHQNNNTYIAGSPEGRGPLSRRRQAFDIQNLLLFFFKRAPPHPKNVDASGYKNVPLPHVLCYKHTWLSGFAWSSFADTVFFHKVKVCDNLAGSKPISTIFPTAFAHFLSLCHILVILAILQLFHYDYICYGDMWSGAFDVTLVKRLQLEGSDDSICQQ